jgi:hypothetical protein
MAKFKERLQHAWNAFLDSSLESRLAFYNNSGTPSYGAVQDRPRLRLSSERTTIASIYTRIAIDVSSVPIRHVRLDEDGRYLEDVKDGLNECLTVQANIDQEARHFLRNVVMALFSHGCIAIVPVDTTINPSVSGSYDIKTMRVGEIVGWHPYHVRVRVYNEKTMVKEEVTLEKKIVGIIENPFYAVMNEHNSTLQRLIHKINLLDQTDDRANSGRMDLIIQLPYVVKTDSKRIQAEQRRKDVEAQLAEGKYGIAYTDGTEKVIQLNRPVENTLVQQVKDLKDQLYVELGLTPEVMNGTADEKAMINYYNRTVEPLLAAIAEAMRSKFLTKTARSQGHWVMYFRDAFKLITMEDLAEIADKFTRNEILSANEIRQGIGIKPSKDPKADELKNSNMPAPSEPAPTSIQDSKGDSQNGRR